MINFYCNKINGISFIRKDLTRANFKVAQAGHKFITKLVLIMGASIFVCLSSAITVFSGGLIALSYLNRVINVYGFIFPTITIIIYILALIIIPFRGFDASLLTTVLFLMLVSALTTILNKNDANYSIIPLILATASGIALAWLGLFITGFLLSFSFITGGFLYELLTIIIATLTAVFLTVFNVDPRNQPITIVVVLIVITISVIISRQSIRGSPKFSWIREKAVFCAATGGTSFYGADLTGACFDKADLRHTDFRNANLTRTSFKGVTGLELARLQGTILEDPKVRRLLTTNNGCGQDFTGANLQGANLQDADLREAILVKAQLLDADLSGACLTNACIQDWNINHKTCFDKVDCQRVYLKCSRNRHFLEPKPDSGEFQPGEFEKWITDVRDTIDLIFQNGLNWRAFAFF